MNWFKRLFKSNRNEEKIKIINKSIYKISNLHEAYLERFETIEKKNKCLTDQVNSLLREKEKSTILLKQISKRLARVEVQHSKIFKKVSEDYSTAMTNVVNEASKFSQFATKQIDEKLKEFSEKVGLNEDVQRFLADFEDKMTMKYQQINPLKEEKSVEDKEEPEDLSGKDSYTIILNAKPKKVFKDIVTYQEISIWADLDPASNVSISYRYQDGKSGIMNPQGVMKIKEGMIINANVTDNT
jgi:hypothetical protein